MPSNAAATRVRTIAPFSNRCKVSSPSSVTSKKTVNSWLKDQVVCVTGGRGALGRRLVRRLADAGVSRVVTLDTLPANSLDQDTRGEAVEHIKGGILDQTSLNQALAGCTLVFHLAALVHAGRSQQDPLSYFQVNALGTGHVMEACRCLGIPRLIYTSTSHVYGITRRLPVDEDHPTTPLSVYAASKLAGENAVQGFAAGCPMSCEIARLSNLYGASFSPETVIGRALEQASSGGPIALHNLRVVRDFIHADDVVEGLVRLAAAESRDPRCRVVNVSTGKGSSVRQVAETLARIAGEEGLGSLKVVQTNKEYKELIPELVLDNGRLSEITGWSPQIDLEPGLRLAFKERQSQKAKTITG